MKLSGGLTDTRLIIQASVLGSPEEEEEEEEEPEQRAGRWSHARVGPGPRQTGSEGVAGGAEWGHLTAPGRAKSRGQRSLHICVHNQ